MHLRAFVLQNVSPALFLQVPADPAAVVLPPPEQMVVTRRINSTIKKIGDDDDGEDEIDRLCENIESLIELDDFTST